MRNDMLLIKTYRSSVGGNAISLEVFTIEKFIETFKDDVYSTWGGPDIRYCPINGKGGYLIKDLEVHQFENIFDGVIQNMSKLLWYYPEEGSIKGKYPFFRKAVYEKYGTKAKRYYDKDAKKYYAEVM